MALNNAVPSFESMLEFQEVYLRAIALSWEDAEFKGALLKNPLEALGRYFHYTCPWLIDLKVVEAPEGAGWDAGKQSWSLPNNIQRDCVEAERRSLKRSAGASREYWCRSSPDT